MPTKARAQGRSAPVAKSRGTSLKTNKPAARKSPSAASPAIAYRVEVADLHAHLFRVTLTIARPAAVQRLSLPAWIPGSYLLREFARHLHSLQARQRDEVLAVTPIDKSTWDVAVPRSDRPLELSWQVYACDNSVRAAWLDTQRAFFNGTSLFLRVHGQEEQMHDLAIPARSFPQGWRLATGLSPEAVDAKGFGRYRADDYDALVDCPVELGPFWQGSFKACGILHRFVVAGTAPGFDGERLLADTRRICEAALRFWHGRPGSEALDSAPPQRDYVFLLNAVDDGYGGLEHRNSTALLCARKDLPRMPPAGTEAGAHKQPEGYATLLGLISHEYFHTWNVKRLRPAEFARYDYTRENPTQLLWFFEGFTSYYDDLLVRRAGLLDDAAYLKSLTRSLNQVLQTPGRTVQSVAQASFDAWTKYYRPDENTPNLTVSYYTKGAAVALCLDLSLRAAGDCTLDDVMRGLWLRCQAGPMTEEDLHDELRARTGRDWPELRAWVHGTDELPLQPLLEAQGVAVLEDASQTAQVLGLRVSEAGGIVVKSVLNGGAAHAAGFAAGDEWLGLEVTHTAAKPTAARRGKSAAGAPVTSRWRLQRLDDLALYNAPGATLGAIVARDRRLLLLPFELPSGRTTWRLGLRDAKRVAAWLTGN